ncbi:type I-E CRISPR-associated protein Cas5/CasD [Gilliamella sp. wkB18]|uniref:type I-E CRISPR-associated protein Cas5/CasD n=1 Tax=Gilliamella sp. wkB18 TaxID=3120260 RepID=UPI0004DD4DF7|nr:type I-E CRISPR-associated protein Cas5/CasD [Gilliamella apicola]KFA59937.1 CRISPR-associated protein, Cas5e family [Gilliamella apicola]OCG61644.1 type I-E CRISPR-associated protein Cas5/CasD [Gilliamella apicola]
MIKHLIFQIYAPLTSWGEHAVGEVRHSNIIPSRSALLGLASAALGIRRDDKHIETFNRHYHFAIRPFIANNSWFRDFHTLQAPRANKKEPLYTRFDEIRRNPKELETLLTHREYYNDVYYQIVMTETEKAPYCVEQIQQALLTPEFPLYIGRKNSPLALPLSPVIYEGTLSDAFVYADKYYRQHHHNDPVICDLIESVADEYYWEHADQEANFDLIKIQLRQDQPINRQRWQFENRRQYVGYLKRSE